MVTGVYILGLYLRSRKDELKRVFWTARRILRVLPEPWINPVRDRPYKYPAEEIDRVASREIKPTKREEDKVNDIIEKHIKISLRSHTSMPREPRENSRL